MKGCFVMMLEGIKSWITFEYVVGLVTIISLILMIYWRYKDKGKDKKKSQTIEELERTVKELVKTIERISPEDASESLKKEVKTAEDRISSPKTAQDFFLKAYAADVDKNYDKAIEYYDKAIRGGYVKAYINMGNAYYKKQDRDKAIEYYEKAIELKPNDADAYNNMGFAYCEKREFDEAIKCYEKAIKLKPDYADAYFKMGNAYRKKQDYYKAIKYYDKAIKLKPDYVDAYNNMGIAYCKKQNFDEAIKCYNKALELNPNYTNARNNIEAVRKMLQEK